MADDRGGPAAEPGAAPAPSAWGLRGQGRRPWLEPGLLPLTLGAFLAGLLARLLGADALSDACWIAGTLLAVVPRIGLGGRGAAAGPRGGGPARRHRPRRHPGGGGVPGRLPDRGHGGHRARARRGGRAACIPGSAGAAGTRAALGPPPPRRSGRDGAARGVLAPGDLLVVAPGEVVAVDGRVSGRRRRARRVGADRRAAAGGARRRRPGAQRRGQRRAGASSCAPPRRRPTAPTRASWRSPGRPARESAPVVRLADRYAAWFLPLSLAVAGVAWVIGGSAVRAVAVLVVATPCPLLLAAPVAIVSGLSRASRIGVVVRSGGALENLGRARTLVLDKTGTLTVGRPAVTEVATAPGADAAEVLRLAASADQLSRHVLAEAIVAEARHRGCRPGRARRRHREPGRGVSATVEGRRVEVGRRASRRGRAVGARPHRPRAARRCGRRLGHRRRRSGRRRAAPRPAAAGRAAHGPAAAVGRPPAAGACSPATGPSPPARWPPCSASTTSACEQTPADKVAAVRAEGERRGHRDGRRRHQRRPCPGRRDRRGGDGRPRLDRVVGGRRRRPHRRPHRPARRRHGDRPPGPPHRRPERRRRDGAVPGRHGSGGGRAAAAGRRCAAAGGHRRRRHPQRAARPRGPRRTDRPGGGHRHPGAPVRRRARRAGRHLPPAARAPRRSWPPLPARRRSRRSGERTASPSTGCCRTRSPRRRSSTRRWPPPWAARRRPLR